MYALINDNLSEIYIMSKLKGKIIKHSKSMLKKQYIGKTEKDANTHFSISRVQENNNYILTILVI